MSDKDLTTIAALVVLALEVITCFFGMWSGDYTALKIVSPVMLLLAGKVFGQGFFDKRKGESE